jgi:predicted DCC family thiol-disulfide oxidoreductase YuxK
MSLRQCIRSWNEFFFTPQPPTTIALFRFLFGLMVIADAVLLWPDWMTWYGEKGVLPLGTALKLVQGTRIDLFTLLPPGDFWVQAYFWVFLLFAFFLTVGFLTKVSSILVFLGLVSMHHRNPFVLHGGDTLLRVLSFFLMFAPAGAAISVDRLWRILKGREGLQPEPRSPWAQRLIQIQAALAYFSTFWWKTQGNMWIDGTALYYVLHLDEFRRFPVLFLEELWLSKLATWFTLLVEFSLGVLVWFKEVRYYILVGAVFFHLGIEYSMNIPLFEWIMIVTYLTFIEPTDLSRIFQWLRERVASRFGDPIPVFYDGSSVLCVRGARFLSVLDIFERLSLVDFRSARALASWPDLVDQRAQGQMLVRTPQGHWYKGFESLRWVFWRLPLLWPLVPFLYLPGMAGAGRQVYARVSQNRILVG